MTAKTTATETYRKDWIIQQFPMIADEIIYKGSPVIVDASSWLAQTNDWTTITIATGDMFAWICVETANSTWLSAGAEYVKVFTEWVFLLPFSDTLTQANVWDKVYLNNVSDDNVFTTTTDTWNSQITVWVILEFVSSSTAYVKINNYVWNIAANA